MEVLFPLELHDIIDIQINLPLELLKIFLLSFCISIFTIFGVLLGVFFKPRAWCQVCPMSHGTGMIDELLKKDKR